MLNRPGDLEPPSFAAGCQAGGLTSSLITLSLLNRRSRDSSAGMHGTNIVHRLVGVVIEL